MAEIEKQQLAIANRLGFKDLKSFRESVKANPKLYAQSREQILDLYRKYIAQMKPELPKLFGRLPKADLIVMPVEPFREKDAPGAQYVTGTPDGSRPGHVEVNTSEPEKRMIISIESTAYHEGVPGHHLQGTIAQEVKDLPPFRQHGWYGAYGEGWALYSERLGKEVGFYQDPYSDFGRLEDEMLRAIRLVVDTGLHYKHWTREQVVQYFHDHSAIDEPNVQSETNRYIAWPAQALSYKMGQLKILELRARAQQQLGASSTSASSTTRWSIPARCRWTCWRSRSTCGSRRRRRSRRRIRGEAEAHRIQVAVRKRSIPNSCVLFEGSHADRCHAPVRELLHDGISVSRGREAFARKLPRGFCRPASGLEPCVPRVELQSDSRLRV